MALYVGAQITRTIVLVVNMSRRIGLFVDISDLYSSVQRAHSGKRLDYKSYYDFVGSLGEIICAMAYGFQKSNEAEGFRRALSKFGYETKYRRLRMDQIARKWTRGLSWNVVLTLDVINRIERLDTIILGSTNKELIPLIEWAREEGVKVIIFAADVGSSMQFAASNVIEIPNSLLVSS